MRARSFEVAEVVGVHFLVVEATEKDFSNAEAMRMLMPTHTLIQMGIGAVIGVGGIWYGMMRAQSDVGVVTGAALMVAGYFVIVFA